MTNIKLTHSLLDVMQKPSSLIRYVKDRPGHDRRYAIDCSKIERELGWAPSASFEQGLQETIEWYRSHQDWVSGVRSGEYRRYYERQYGKRPRLPSSGRQAGREDPGELPCGKGLTFVIPTRRL